jgi:hypothetical protein
MTIKCAHCHQTHYAVATVLLCSQGLVFPCSWLEDRGYDEDGGKVILECGAGGYETPRGWECEAGHEHVTLEAQEREGWRYAEDRYEAGNFLRAGFDVVGMDGGSFRW